MINMDKTKKSKAGFTLIEMLAVLFIIGIIFSITLPTFGPIIRTMKLKTSADNLVNVLESARQYAVTSGQYCDVVFPITGDLAYKAYQTYSLKDDKTIDRNIGKAEVLPNGIVIGDKSSFMRETVSIPFPDKDGPTVTAKYLRFKPDGRGETGGNVYVIDPNINFRKITVPTSPRMVHVYNINEEPGDE